MQPIFSNKVMLPWNSPQNSVKDNNTWLKIEVNVWILYGGPEVSGQIQKPQHKYKSHNTNTKATNNVYKVIYSILFHTV